MIIANDFPGKLHFLSNAETVLVEQINVNVDVTQLNAPSHPTDDLNGIPVKEKENPINRLCYHKKAIV